MAAGGHARIGDGEPFPSLADEAERTGFVERVTVADDRRSRTLRLTAKGRKVRATALAPSDQLEYELQEAVGPRAVTGLRAGLIAIVTQSGALDDVLARRARLVW